MVNRDTALDTINKLIELDQKSPKRILVTGDVMYDRYIHGHVDPKICQEGCPKFIEEEDITVFGGAANAHNSLRNWSATVRCPINSCGVYRPIKTRFMVDNKCLFRHDNDKWDIKFEVARTDCFNEMCRFYPDAVLISDYNKGFLTPEYIKKIVVYCEYAKIPCVADVKREPEIYQLQKVVLKCNIEYSQKYAGRYNRDPFVVTRGSETPAVNGHMLYNVDEAKTYKLNPVKCINHVGAGDCFAAHLTLALAYGFSLKESATIAHSAGRVYVQRRHNHPPTPEEIRSDIMGESLCTSI